MSQHSHNMLAHNILTNNVYTTLATTDGQMPWASPVFYCLDEEYNFYFVSQANSTHIKNMNHNPVVAFAVFDSAQTEGAGNGVQGVGAVTRLTGSEIQQGLKYYYTSFLRLNPADLNSSEGYSLYKLKPSELYVLHDTEENTDQRKRVFL